MTEDERHSFTAEAAGPAREARPTRGGRARLPPGPREGAAGPRSPYSVELHIEELMLQGFADVEGRRVGDAVERELARLLNEQGAPPAIRGGGEVARLDGGAFEVQPGSDPETIGVSLARAIYGGLGQ